MLVLTGWSRDQFKIRSRSGSLAGERQDWCLAFRSSPAVNFVLHDHLGWPMRHDAAGPPCTPPDVRLIEVSALQTKRGAMSSAQDLAMRQDEIRFANRTGIVELCGGNARIRAGAMQQMVHCLAGRTFLNA